MATREKSKEEALPQGNDRFRLLFESVADALFLHDLEGRFVEVNQAACDSLGYTREELLRLPFSTIVKDGDPKALGDLWARVLLGKKLTIQGFHQRRGGAVFPVEVHLSPFDYEGRPHILASARDITERKQAEAALAESEQRFSTFMEHLPAAVFIKDQAGRLVFANRYLRETFGWQDCLGKNTEELLPREMAEQMIADDRRVLAAGQTLIQEKITDVQGSERFFDTYKFPIMAEGSPVLLGGIAVDVTDRHLMEEALHKEKLLTEAILDSLPGTFFLLDSQGKQLRTNKSEMEITGYSWEELANMHALESIAEEDRPAAQNAIEEVLEKGEASLEARMLTKDGRKIPFLFTARKFVIDGVPFILGSGLDITARKHAEEALRESEKKYRFLYQKFQGILNTIPDTVCLISPDLRIIWGNEATAHDISKSDMSEVLGQHCYALRHFTTEPCKSCPVLKCFDSGKVETEVHFAHGRLWELRAFPVYDDQGELVGAIEDARDVTQQKQMEEDLRESRALFQDLVETAQDLIWQCDAAGRYTYLNPAWEEVFGYRIEEMLGKCFSDFQPPEYAARDQREFARLLQGKIIKGLETVHLAKDGKKLHLVFNAKVVRDKDGLIIGTRGTAYNISKRKRAEEALRESEERYRSLFQNNHAVMLLIDPETGAIMDANPAACAYYGFAKEELLAKKITDLNTLTPKQVFQAMHRAKVEGRHLFEFRHRLAGGEVRDVEVFSGPMRIKGRELLFSIVHDVTARKEAELALQQSEAKFRQMVESAPLPIGISTAAGTIEYVNPKFVETFGYTLEDVPRLKDWFRLAYPDPAYRQDAVARWQMAMEKTSGEGGASQNIEVWITCKDGSHRIMEISGAQMGRQTLAVFNDLTERKRMEEVMEKRLVALSRPLGDMTDIEFQDLFNLEEIQRLSDLFAKSTGVGGLLTTPDGQPITKPSNFCRLCGSFIRQTEKGRRKCFASDSLLGRHNPAGPTIQHCLSAGLCGAGASITVGGKHIANWLIGQVRDESVSEEKIREYARDLELDEEEFIAAFREVPIMSKDRFQQVAQALFIFANQLSTMAYNNVQQARFITERKRAEEALRDSEERLRLALQAANQGLYDLNVQTGETKVSPEYATMLGYDPGKFQETNARWIERLHPDDRERVAATYQAYVRGDIPNYEVEFRQRTQSGDWKWILSLGRVVAWDEDGTPLRMLGTHTDITQRKRMEESLVRTQFAVDHARDSVLWVRPDGSFAYVNQAFCDFSGYSREELRSLSIFDIRPVLSKQQWLDEWEESRKLGSLLLESLHKNKDGRIFPVEVAINFIKFDGEEYHCAFARDITERKKAEEALRESEKRLREAQEMAHLGFWHWNVKTGEVSWSDEVYKIFQLNPQEFTPHIDSIMKLSPWPEDHERDQELICKAMETHERGTFEQRFLLPDKSIGYYYSTFQGKYDDAGNLLSIVGTVLDITERKRAEEERAKLETQMQEVQKLESLGVLAGGIAHDFNNLLMAILGNADLALLALSPASPARPNVEEITRASLRAADLCRQMLAYSGKGRFVVGRYNLSEIVQEMTQILEVSVSKKATLRYNFATGLPAVEVDVTQVRQVIMNLITNASEALGDENGVISVSTGVMNCDRAYLAESYLDDKLPEGQYVYLEVTDTGVGIDEETRRRIFDPFFTTKFTGRGLGLAAVLGIVRGHQGAIKVYSEVGHGSSFKVLLPAQEWVPGDRKTSPVTSIKPILGGGTILLIDDDPEVRDVGTQMLKRLGFKVLIAANGQEGLQIFQESGGRIDCVILDLTMPEMGGEEVFRELRRLRSDVRVILSSGYNEQDVTQRFTGKGLAGFIQKPYRVAKLQEVLNRILH